MTITTMPEPGDPNPCRLMNAEAFTVEDRTAVPKIGLSTYLVASLR